MRSSVNLMDHDAAVYSERTSLADRVRASLHSVSSFLLPSSGTDLAHADAAMADDFVCDAPMKRTKRLTPVSAKLSSILRNRYVQYLLLGLGVIGIVTTTLLVTHKPEAQKIYEANDMRLETIRDHILLNGVTHADDYKSPQSPESHALRWIAYTDPARMDPLDPMILQRYALAVFFYGSFLRFQEYAGVQTIVDETKPQWQGVPNAGWTKAENWLTGKGICTWHGVKCEIRYDEHNNAIMHYDDNAKVVGLNLEKNHVMGVLPNEFKALDMLEDLDLSDNYLTGTIPWQIMRMYRIQHFLIDNNQMTGTIPTFIGEMEGIRELRLTKNHFNGTIPTEIGRLELLRTLGLDQNQFSGALPHLEGLTSLHYVFLSNNRFNGSLPIGYGTMHQLVDLHIDHNQIGGTVPPELATLTKLERIIADNNRLVGTLPDFWMKFLLNLEVLSLQHNQLTGDLPVDVADSPRLQELLLNDNKFTGSIPAWDGDDHLTRIHMHNNLISGWLPPSFGNMTSLQELWLHNNKVHGKLPYTLGQLTNLESMYLERNQLTGHIPPTLSQLSKLEELRIFGNSKLQGKVQPDICALKKRGRLQSIAVDCGSIECLCCECGSG